MRQLLVLLPLALTAAWPSAPAHGIGGERVLSAPDDPAAGMLLAEESADELQEEDGHILLQGRTSLTGGRAKLNLEDPLSDAIVHKDREYLWMFAVSVGVVALTTVAVS
eukprot:gnl/TRDRNA2_/TRDRNA2_181354_c0_seq1.p1 gnl/TRDRNA2_/TRDRNA2_181354_c0~~gnl/TRDRNA2_/TRDRNA2_181354_c0_seq1.p1  ORF type:complete len:109 (+),score=19.97 gnl/TRDRNA2_/TRDRNA2_181354_c0_seq1:100-426(+)